MLVLLLVSACSRPYCVLGQTPDETCRSCTEPLRCDDRDDNSSYCPDSVDEAIANCPEDHWEEECGGATRVSCSGGFGGLVHYFRDGELIGVVAFSDVNAYCDNTSFEVAYGEVPAGCR